MENAGKPWKILECFPRVVFLNSLNKILAYFACAFVLRVLTVYFSSTKLHNKFVGRCSANAKSVIWRRFTTLAGAASLSLSALFGYPPRATRVKTVLKSLLSEIVE